MCSVTSLRPSREGPPRPALRPPPPPDGPGPPAAPSSAPNPPSQGPVTAVPPAVAAASKASCLPVATSAALACTAAATSSKGTRALFVRLSAPCGRGHGQVQQQQQQGMPMRGRGVGGRGPGQWWEVVPSPSAWPLALWTATYQYVYASVLRWPASFLASPIAHRPRPAACLWSHPPRPAPTRMYMICAALACGMTATTRRLRSSGSSCPSPSESNSASSLRSVVARPERR